MVSIRRKFCLCSAIIFLLVSVVSCTISYKFNGSSIDYTKVKSISVAMFPNHASLVYPALSPNFTEVLRDAYSSKTSLVMLEKNGDLQVSGEITGYSLSPTAVNSQGNSTMTRLTVVVNVRFSNQANPSEDFERSFSAYQEFSNTQTINQVQEELCETIVEELVDLIFNATVANW